MTIGFAKKPRTARAVEDRICAWLDFGVSVAELARRFDLHQETVRNIWRRRRKNAPLPFEAKTAPHPRRRA